MSDVTTARTGTDANGAEAEIGRPVVVSSFLSLDGYSVGPDEDVSWVAEGFDPEMQADIADEMGERYGTFLFGRVTFEIFAAYWPHAVPYEAGDALRPAEGREDPRIIRALDDNPKVVFSRTLTGSDWSNVRVVAADPEDEVRRLRAEPGRAISVQGSASIVQALARADLVDEYRLYIHPVVLGAGKLLFGPGPGRRRDFSLTASKAYANGVVALTHRRARPPA